MNTCSLSVGRASILYLRGHMLAVFLPHQTGQNLIFSANFQATFGHKVVVCHHVGDTIMSIHHCLGTYIKVMNIHSMFVEHSAYFHSPMLDRILASDWKKLHLYSIVEVTCHHSVLIMVFFLFYICIRSVIGTCSMILGPSIPIVHFMLTYIIRQIEKNPLSSQKSANVRPLSGGMPP